MDSPEHLVVKDGYARFSPTGTIALSEAAARVTEVIAYCREQAVPRLLVVTSDWSGLSVPSTTERFSVATSFARAAGSAVKAAMVLSPEMIDPRRFGVTVARNRGMITEVFTSEAEALAWLLKTDAT